MSFPNKKFLPLLISLVFVGILAFIVNEIKRAGYHITYSATKSMPRGLYLVIPAKKIVRYDIVEFLPPANILEFIREKHWVPQSGLIIKYVYAIPGDQVCIRKQTILVNNQKIGSIYKFYAPNKLLPQTKICGKLKENQYLLLSTESDRSFDSRYFGPIYLQQITGKAIPLVTTSKKNKDNS